MSALPAPALASDWAETATLDTVVRLRAFLLSFGFTDRPLADLSRVATRAATPRVAAEAARELALWRLREGTEAAAEAALGDVALARGATENPHFRTRLAVIELLALDRLGRRAEARAAFEAACLDGACATDPILAWANLAATAEARAAAINHAMEHHGLPPIALGPTGATPYDRLTTAWPTVAADGPTVTVLVAAWNAEDTIGTAIRSLRAQSWRALEILVLDDCSTDGTTEAVERAADGDPRVRLVGMARNGGAYVARNHGLRLATGEYVTLHDADDWSHPLKIERQARFLAETPEAVACFSEQARMTPDLHFRRWTGRGQFLIRNVSSFMFRRAPVHERLGFWDNVRVAADMELVRRVERTFGPRAVVDLPTGPLSFQRDGASSAIASGVLGMNGFYFGARRDYVDAQLWHHDRAASLRYGDDPGARPFPAPGPMLVDRPGERRFDVAFASDLRRPDPALCAEIDALRADRRTVALIEVHDYDPLAEPDLPMPMAMDPDLRARVDGAEVAVLVYGDTAEVGALHGALPRDDRRYMPEITVGGG